MRVSAPAGLRLCVAIVASVLLNHAHSEECSITTPTGAWTPEVVYKAASAGVPVVSVPSKVDGFNRTVKLQGFCHNILFASSQFTCDTSAAGEKRVKAVPNNGLELNVDEKRCELSAISFAKVAGGAEMQFRFETCTEGAKTSVIAIPLVKTPSESSMLQWLEKVCEDTIPTTTTQAVIAASVSHEKELKQVSVGMGLCNGEFMSNESAPDNQGECIQTCAGTIGIDESHATCSGYAFNANAEPGKKCMLFKGVWTGVKKDSPADWLCFNLTLTTAKEKSTTPEPAPLAVEGVLTQNLELKVAEAFGGPPPALSTAQLRAILPPEDNTGCFLPVHWFTLEDADGTPGSFPVNEADWDKLMSLIPDPLPMSGSAPSQVVLDRLLVVSDCTERENEPISLWGRQCEIKEEANFRNGFQFNADGSTPIPCEVFEILNSILTGILTPLAAWIAVRVGYNYLKPKYKAEHDLIDPCSVMIAGILCGVAFLAAVITAILVSQIFNLVSLIFGCAQGFGDLEMSILTSAAFISAAVAIIVALGYLYISHPKNQEGSKKKKDKTYLVMEVEEGANGSFATPVYMETNPMHSKAGSESFMASTMSSGTGTGTQMRSIMLTG